MSNLLVPASVVARRKGSRRTQSRSTNGAATNQTFAGSTGAAPPPSLDIAAAAFPPGFQVPAEVPTVQTVVQQPAILSSPPTDWQFSSFSLNNGAPPSPLFPCASPTAADNITLGIVLEDLTPPSFEPIAPPAGILPAFMDVQFEQPMSLAKDEASGTAVAPLIDDGESELLSQTHGNTGATSEELNTFKTTEPENSNKDNDDPPVEILIKEIVKENVEGSAFHAALTTKLETNASNGMSQTEVLSVLLGFPDLVNLFCTTQSQYNVLPGDILRELTNVMVRQESGENRFYLLAVGNDGKNIETPAKGETAVADSVDYVQGDTTEAALDEGDLPVGEALTPGEKIAIDNEQQSLPGKSSAGQAATLDPNTDDNDDDDDVVDCWENLLSDDDESTLRDQDKTPEDMNIGATSSNEVLEQHSAVIDPGNVSPTTASVEVSPSASTSPTTVTTATSGDSEDYTPSNSTGKERSKPKRLGDGTLTDMEETDQSKAALNQEVYQEKAQESTEQEDRNDGHGTSANECDQHESKDRDRNDEGNRESDAVDAVATPARASEVKDANGTPGSASSSNSGDRRRLAPRSNAKASPTASADIKPAKQQPPKLPKSPRALPERTKGTVANAVLDFLGMLYNEIEEGTNEWPDDQTQFKEYLTKITNCVFSKHAQGITKRELPKAFRSWFEEIVVRYNGDSKRLSKIRKEATNKLLQQLIEMECVECGSLLHWRKRKVETLVIEYEKHRPRGGPNTDKKVAGAGKTKTEEGKPGGKGKKEANIWQDQHKIEALVNGYQPKEKGSTLSAARRKASLRMVVLKNQRNNGGTKASPTTPVPPTPQNQQDKGARGTSAWKVTPPGMLHQPQLHCATQKERVQHQHLVHNSPPAFRPLAMQASAAGWNGGKTPSTSMESAAPKLGLVTPPRAGSELQQPDNTGTTGAAQLNMPLPPTSHPSLLQSPLRQAQGAFQEVRQAAAKHYSSANDHNCSLSQQEFGVTGTTLDCSGSGLRNPVSLNVTSDIPALLELLPPDLASYLSDSSLQQQLTDIVLDKGRQPMVWTSGVRKLVGEDGRIVTGDDLDCIVQKLGGFGQSNRIGLDQQLHSVSAIRNRKNDIIGLSMRVGRHISGIADMISDILFDDPTKSILFLGDSGSGKTTILRDVTRLLAKESDVMIVDTVNEIAGDGDIPHPCVGAARRMMVPSLSEQGSIIEECIQNHCPGVIVVDKLGHQDEVEAARSCKDQDIRLIASMNGNLKKLVKNNKLRGLIGVESVAVGQSLGKANLHRTGAPAFDVIVELCPGTHHEWKIILNTAEAVDKLIRGEPYQYQRRIRNPSSGSFSVRVEDA